ncbi:MAG TPA: MarR family transcriptional regulator [Nitrospira sp.]|nr:MarR family transcriptional regulator [Nitrospira sp.]
MKQTFAHASGTHLAAAKQKRPSNSGQTSVEKVIRQWHRARPGLDLGPLALFAAIAHAYWLSAPRIERLMARYNLTRGMFDVLTTLRRSGPPYELAPKQLSHSLLLSGAGITNRLDRLEDLKLIVRRPDPHDRRGLQIKITSPGLKLVDRVLPELIELERQMAAGLTRQDAAHLMKLLDKVSTSMQAVPDED